MRRARERRIDLGFLAVAVLILSALSQVKDEVSLPRSTPHVWPTRMLRVTFEQRVLPTYTPVPERTPIPQTRVVVTATSVGTPTKTSIYLWPTITPETAVRW